MKIVNELPKRKPNKPPKKKERRVREIRKFAESGAKYAEMDYLTMKNIYSNMMMYKDALAEYKAQGGEGDFQLKTVNGHIYIIREESAPVKKEASPWYRK